jgi:hypothetical protein
MVWVFVMSGSDGGLVGALPSRGTGARARDAAGFGYETTKVPVDAAETCAGAEPVPSRIGVVANDNRRSDGPASVIGGR